MIPIDTLSDPRLEPYRNLKDKQLAGHGWFIVEGKRVVLRLLASSLGVESVIADERRAPEMAAALGDRAPLYVVSCETMREMAGFKIETGVLAIGLRPPSPTLEDVMRRAANPATLLVVPIVKEPANLGALVRTATAFGMDGLILGPHCCDPFYRRTVRVSMGTVFRLPIVRSDDLERDLRELRERWDVELCGTVLAEDAEPLREARRTPGKRGTAILLGHEVDGLEARWVDLCDRRLTIPMHLGTDSLNVSVAAAIFGYHFMAPTRPIRLPEASDAD